MKTRSIHRMSPSNWTPQDRDIEWRDFSAIVATPDIASDQVRVLFQNGDFFKITFGTSSGRSTSEKLSRSELAINQNITAWSFFDKHHLFMSDLEDGIYTGWQFNETNDRFFESFDFNGFNPTLVILGIEGQGSDAIATVMLFIDNLWSIQSVKYGMSPKLTNNLLWLTSDEFFGCSRNPCFNGNIDAIHSDIKNPEIQHIYVGSYKTSFKFGGSLSLPLDNGLSEYDDNRLITKSITAAFGFSEDQSVYLLTSTGHVFQNNLLIYPKAHQLFPGIDESDTIDAAFAINNQVTLIIGQRHTVWTYWNGIFSLNINFTRNINRWSPIFKTIDAAFVDRQQIFFVSRSYYISVSAMDDVHLENALIQRRLFYCPDDNYNKPSIDFYNFGDFSNNQKLFEPEIESNLTSTTPTYSTPDSSTPNQLKPTTHPTTPNPTPITVITVLVAILLVFVIIGGLIFCYLHMKAPKRSSSKLIASSVVTMNSDVI